MFGIKYIGEKTKTNPRTFLFYFNGPILEPEPEPGDFDFTFFVFKRVKCKTACKFKI